MGAISTSVTLQGPFDLPLSIDAAARFLPPRGLVPTVLKVAARIDRRPAVFEIRQTRRVTALFTSFRLAHRQSLAAVVALMYVGGRS